MDSPYDRQGLYAKVLRSLRALFKRMCYNDKGFLCGKRGFCGPWRDPAPWPYSLRCCSNTSRTLLARAVGVKGFCKNAVSASKVACRTSAASL